MARPGHHPGVFMALALPAYPAEAVGVHQSPGRIPGRAWRLRPGVAGRNTFLGQ